MAPPATQVLRDPERDERLREDGYAIVPLLSADEVTHLRTAYRALVDDPDAPGNMEFDYMAADRSRMRVVADLLAPVWDRHLPELFVDHEAVFATFVCKHPGPVSGMFLHDDRTYLDERRQRAFTVWVPLVDVSPELDNGTLYLVPGSHRIVDAFSAHFAGRPGWTSQNEAAAAEAKTLTLSSDLAERSLGWRPRLDLDRALEWTAGWYRAHRDGRDMLDFSRAQIAAYEALAQGAPRKQGMGR